MSRLATTFVLGYHGCDQSTANKAINGDADLVQSNRDFDWLGSGVYFWESDPQRALEWAQWKVSRGEYQTAAVVGAVIDLRNCLDLSSREDLELLRIAYIGFESVQRTSGLPIPENKNIRGQPDADPDADRVLRFLDCAVIRHLHSILESQPVEGRTVEPFDTVRGMFTEGGRVYPGSGFHEKSHVQIAVRNHQCIRGLFKPRPNPGGSAPEMA